MLTAERIATKTGIELRTVRYRLSVLRRSGEVTGLLIGQTWAYYAGAVNKVLKFGKGKSK